MYRPAWRINQTGVQSTGSRRQALRNRSFIRDGILVRDEGECQFNDDGHDDHHRADRVDATRDTTRLSSSMRSSSTTMCACSNMDLFARPAIPPTATGA